MPVDIEGVFGAHQMCREVITAKRGAAVAHFVSRGRMVCDALR